MPYIKCTIEAGNTIETRKYFSARYGKKSNRAERKSETEPKQKRINENNASDRLTWLINSNFGNGDYHIVLTYSRDNKPTSEDAARILSAYLRKLRKEYHKKSMELKYIAVTEYEKHRIHHHIIINKFDTDIISSLWDKGKAHFTTLDSSGDYSKLASYLVKETNRTYQNGTVSSKRWNSSRNLKQPKITKEIVKADSWTKSPKPIKGYYILPDSITEDIDIFGFPYQRYTMVKIPQQNRKTRAHQIKSPPRLHKKQELTPFHMIL